MSAWQPIESAPKDRAILAFERVSNALHIIAPMYWAGHEWLIVQFHNINTELAMKPTHWMEIPEAPK